MRSTSTSSRLELVAGDAEAAAVELLELAALRARSRTSRSSSAELRAEHRQVRLHAELARLDLAELDLLDAQLVGDLVRVRSRARRRALDDEPAQRLAQLQPRRRRAPGGRARRRGAPRRSRRAARASGSRRSGQPARCTDAGAVLARGCARGARRGTASPARRRAATARARTRASANAASSSPSQKRRRERRMYQLERSSTNASNARIDVDRQRRLVRRRSPRRRAACVRSTSQRSSGAARRPARSASHVGVEALDVRVVDEELAPSSRASAACA